MALDLSRIDAVTREVLETEARKRGIRSPEFRTRAELVRLIIRDQYGEQLAVGRELIAQGAKTVSQARGLLGGVLGSALSVLPEPLDALARLRSRLSLPPARPPERAAPSQPPVPRPPVRASEPPLSPAPGSVSPQPVPAPSELDEFLETVAETAPEVSAAVGSPARPAQSSAPPPAGAFMASTPPPPLRASEAPRSFSVAMPPPEPPRPSASEPSTRTFVEEPIRTRSMARLLASQGHQERALAIYEELLAQNSEDLSLRAETEALRRGEVTPEPHLSSPAPRADGELPDGGDRLWCEGDAQVGLRLRWQLTESGQNRARAVLGHDGELAIRVVTIKPDAAAVVRSEITEHGPVASRGEWVTPGPMPSSRCFAAVGLRDGNRFVAVVHARPTGTMTPAT